MEDFLIHPVEPNKMTARLTKFVQEYNKQHEQRNYMAKGKKSCQGKIVVGAVTLAEKLLVRMHKTLKSVSLTSEFQESQSMPSVYFSRPELSNLLAVASKSVYNYMDKLIRAGIIEKIWHGTSHQFEIRFNQWVLFGDIYEMPDFQPVTNGKISQKFAVYKDFSIKKTKNLPNTTTLNTLKGSNNYYNSGTNSVENLSFSNVSSTSPQNLQESGSKHEKLHEKSGLQSDRPTVKETSTLATSKQKAGGAASSSYPQNNPQNEDNRVRQSRSVVLENGVGNHFSTTDTDLHTYKMQLCVAYWAVLREKFYSEQYFSTKHEKDILNLIWRDVFGSFVGIDSFKKADMFYQYRLRLIEKAYRNYLKRSWQSVLPPLNYLSIDFYQKQKQSGEKGSIWFVQEWIKKDDAQLKRNKIENLVNKAMQNIAEGRIRGLKGGGNMTKLQISVYWRKRLMAFNNYELMKEFENRLLAQNQIRQTKVSYAIG